MAGVKLAPIGGAVRVDTTISPTFTRAGARKRVCFFTDFEGNFEYFERCIELSQGLHWQVVDGTRSLKVRDGWHAVFGGDYVDKGPCAGAGGSLRVVECLVALKKAYPSRVILILGNRDLNKMRFTSELSEGELANLDGTPGPYWVPEGKRVTPRMYLERLLAKQRAAEQQTADAGGAATGGAAAGTGLDDEQALASLNTLANRIRWMLTDTMGADGEFERRRLEMSLLQSGGTIGGMAGNGMAGGGGSSAAGAARRLPPPSDSVASGGIASGSSASLPDDSAVAASFVSSVAPGGALRELLCLGQ